MRVSPIPIPEHAKMPYPRRWTPIDSLRALRAGSSVLSMRSATMHPTAYVHRGSILTPQTTIGAYTRINGPCRIRDNALCAIGKWNAIGHLLHIVTANHLMSYANVVLALDHHLGLSRPVDARGGVVIGNACWVGDRVTLLPGSVLGDGAVVGAGAVVTTAIPPFAIAMGVPARVYRPRFSPAIAEVLLELAWWDWSIERIERNRVFFALDLTTASRSAVLDVIVD